MLTESIDSINNAIYFVTPKTEHLPAKFSLKTGDHSSPLPKKTKLNILNLPQNHVTPQIRNLEVFHTKNSLHIPEPPSLSSVRGHCVRLLPKIIRTMPPLYIKARETESSWIFWDLFCRPGRLGLNNLLGLRIIFARDHFSALQPPALSIILNFQSCVCFSITSSFLHGQHMKLAWLNHSP